MCSQNLGNINEYRGLGVSFLGGDLCDDATLEESLCLDGVLYLEGHLLIMIDDYGVI